MIVRQWTTAQKHSTPKKTLAVVELRSCSLTLYLQSFLYTLTAFVKKITQLPSTSQFLSAIFLA